jgi:hypothetical protein
MTENNWWQTETNDEVATKRELWEPLADAVGGFDLDPAAGCEPTPIAEERYTPEDDGLAQPWFGTVWLNPPFDNKARWYRKLYDEFRNGDVDCVVAVARVDTSTDWFHDTFVTADVIGFLDGRDWYIGGDSPSFASMVGLWNPTLEAEAALDCLGTVAEPITEDEQQTQLGES